MTTGDPSFDPEPFTAQRLADWKQSIRGELDATLAALRLRREQLPEDGRAVAEQALAAAEALHAVVEKRASGPTTALAIRLHGDFHLGQALVTKNDFIITDLEGEPGRSLAERRAKHTVLKDVAAMLRSIDYARVVAARQFAARPSSGAVDVRAFLDDWRLQTHAAFREAYRAAIGDCRVWPREEREVEHLLKLATIERVLYEIRYELTHRPELVAVPLLDLTSFREA